MKVYEILALNAELLERLHGFGINTEDYKDAEIYKEFIHLRSKGNKVVYAVAVLSEKFNVCERKIYKVISKMEKDCRFGAVG